MDWTRLPSSERVDPHGVADLLARACEEARQTTLAGTRFMLSAREMLRATRVVEAHAALARGPLYVGVQDAANLDEQRDVYRTLLDQGVAVVAFGVGQGFLDLPGLAWVPVPDDSSQLASQWFLVTEDPSPMALVGFEVGPATQRIRWEGFTTRDARLVELLAAHLASLHQAVTVG